MLCWDSDQFFAVVVVKQIIYLAVIDAGSCQMLVHIEIACILYLRVKIVQNGEFGCYIIPGATNMGAYYGLIYDLFTL